MYRAFNVGLGMFASLALAACGGTEGEESGREVARPSARVAAVQDPAAAASEAAPPVASEIEVSAPEEAQPRPAPENAASVPPAAPQTRAAEPTETPVADPGVQGILRRAEEAYEGVRSMEADFVQDLSVPLLGTSQRSRGTLYLRRPDRFLMKFTDPAGDIVVADGEHLWMYYPSTDRTQVIQTTLAEGGRQVDLQREFLRNATERYHATLLREESVGGRPAYVLRLIPKQASAYREVKVWVDKKDHLVRRFEITEQNDSVRRLELSSLEPNVSLPDRLFQFTPPPGTQVFRQ